MDRGKEKDRWTEGKRRTEGKERDREGDRERGKVQTVYKIEALPWAFSLCFSCNDARVHVITPTTFRFGAPRPPRARVRKKTNNFLRHFYYETDSAVN